MAGQRRDGFDLNALKPAKTVQGGYNWDVTARGASNGVVSAHLGDIATPLVSFLEGSEAVVGCVAWITSPRLVNAMLGKPVSLVVNKEWELRARVTKPKPVRDRLNLARLSGGLRYNRMPAPVSEMGFSPGTTIDPVRCAGHISVGWSPNHPMLHHKFVVRLEHGKPVAVFVGSFNFSVNAESSLESATEIHDPVIAAAFFNEWARVLAVSEPLEFAAGKAATVGRIPRTPKPAPSKRPTKRTAAAKKPVARKPVAKTATNATTPAKPALAKKPAARRPARKTTTAVAAPTAAKPQTRRRRRPTKPAS
jgi:hypothetical protein